LPVLGYGRTGLHKSMDQRRKVLRQRLLRRAYRWCRHAPVSLRLPYGATDEELLVLVEYVNVGVPCTVERLQKGIAGTQEECREVRQHDGLLHGWAMDGERWH
jgi:hypothetical protein